MNYVSWDILDQYVVVYLDDILVFSNNPDSTLVTFEWPWSLYGSRLYDKLEKCMFVQISTEFLGFILIPEGSRWTHARSRPSVAGCPPCPTPTMLDLQRFLGFTNFYELFISHFLK